MTSCHITATKAVLICTLCWLLMARITNELDVFFNDSPLGIKILSLALPHSGLLYGIAALTYKTGKFCIFFKIIKFTTEFFIFPFYYNLNSIF